VTAVIPVPDFASVLAVGPDAVWVTSVPGDSVTRIDPVATRATGTTSLAPGGIAPIGITVEGSAVWVAVHDGEPTGSVARLDAATMAILDEIPVGDEPFAGPSFIAAGAGSIWTNVPNIESVVRIDPATNTVAQRVNAGGQVAPIRLDAARSATARGTATSSAASTPRPAASPGS
jgi:hypothetical protein